MLQSASEYFKVLGSVSKYFRDLQNAPEIFKGSSSILKRFRTNFLFLLPVNRIPKTVFSILVMETLIALARLRAERSRRRSLLPFTT